MRLLIYSDLHLEFDGYTPKKEWLDKCDILVQVGDVHHARNSIKQLKSWGVPAIFVPGNHDYWNPLMKKKVFSWMGGTNKETVTRCEYTMEEAVEIMREEAEGSDVIVLENDTFCFNSVRFIGATLWYDASKMASHILTDLNDYKRTFNEKRELITPSDITFKHRETVSFIRRELKKYHDGKTVLLTHHPAWLVPGLNRQLGDYAGAYGTDLSNLWTGSVDLMVHGHVHETIDTVVNGTHIICNPRGYPGDDTRRTFKKQMFVDI